MNDLERELGQIQQKLENTSNIINEVKTNIIDIFKKLEKDSKDTIETLSELKGNLKTIREVADINNTQKNNEIRNVEKDIETLKLDLSNLNTEVLKLETKLDASIKTIKFIGALTVGLSTIICGIITAIQFFH